MVERRCRRRIKSWPMRLGSRSPFTLSGAPRQVRNKLQSRRPTDRHSISTHLLLPGPQFNTPDTIDTRSNNGTTTTSPRPALPLPLHGPQLGLGLRPSTPPRPKHHNHATHPPSPQQALPRPVHLASNPHHRILRTAPETRPSSLHPRECRDAALVLERAEREHKSDAGALYECRLGREYGEPEWAGVEGGVGGAGCGAGEGR